MAKMTIKINPAHAGLLRKHLGTPKGEKIPTAKLNQALNSKDPVIRKRAQFAKNARSWSH